MSSLGDTDVPFIPQERIDLRSVIAAFTINAASINIIDNITGSMDVGKLADSYSPTGTITCA